MQAHLIGGIPDDEIAALGDQLAQFGIAADSLFAPERAGYQALVETIDAKPAIKRVIEADVSLAQTVNRHQAVLESWWAKARDDFAQLENARNGGKQSPEVRQGLITSLKSQLVPLGVLDEFKSAGVFVNWWQQIRYDLKTIIATGWHHSLIPNAYLVDEFFQSEADAIEALEAAIAERQAALDEAVETAIEVAAWEPEGDEKATAAVLKKALKLLIDDLKSATSASAVKEHDALKAQDAAIKAIEKRIKTAKTAHKAQQHELEQKLELKRLGGDGFKAEARALIEQNAQRLKQLDPANKADKKTIKALEKDQAALQTRLKKTDVLLTDIGGQLTDTQARELILKKLYDIVHAELDRYLNAEKRALIAAVENLWEKYAVSSRALEDARNETLRALDGMLAGLRYL